MKNTLFESTQLGAYTLKNRIVMAPMTRSRATADHVPTDIMADYYAQRAGAGLIITEATIISPRGNGYLNVPGMFNQAQIDGWRKVTNAVHKKKGLIFAQLWHVGRVSLPEYHAGQLPVAPSAIKAEGSHLGPNGEVPFVTPHALTISEIADVITDYKQAAINAKAAGFDGVELHAGYSYLLEQFLRDGSNQRDDQYGGSSENRTRIIFEILDAISEVFNQNQISLRISPINVAYQPFHIVDSDIEETYSYLVAQLNRYDLAYLHVVENIGGDKLGNNFDVKKLREIYKGTYLANGGYNRDKAMMALDNNSSDLIGFAFPFIANPDFVLRLENNLELSTPDMDKLYVGGASGYTDYHVAALASAT